MEAEGEGVRDGMFGSLINTSHTRERYTFCLFFRIPFASLTDSKTKQKILRQKSKKIFLYFEVFDRMRYCSLVYIKNMAM